MRTDEPVIGRPVTVELIGVSGVGLEVEVSPYLSFFYRKKIHDSLAHTNNKWKLYG